MKAFLFTLAFVGLQGTVGHANEGDTHTFKVTVHGPAVTDGRGETQPSAPLSNVNVTAVEYRTARWYEGNRSETRSAKTNQNGEAVISYQEDKHHYADTVVCVKMGTQTLCGGVGLGLIDSPTMCFDNLARSKTCRQPPQVSCDFKVDRSSSGPVNGVMNLEINVDVACAKAP